MQATYNKYGEFQYVVLAVLDPKEAEVYEQHLIDTYLGNHFCVNICPSAAIPTRKGMRNSTEHRAKISASRKGLVFDVDARQNMSTGQKRRFADGWSDELRETMMLTRNTPEYRQKLSLAQTGKTLTSEAKAKITAANQGKTLSPETRAKLSKSLQGIERSEIWRARISAANTGRKATEETKAKMRLAQVNRQKRERLTRNEIV